MTSFSTSATGATRTIEVNEYDGNTYDMVTIALAPVGPRGIATLTELAQLGTDGNDTINVQAGKFVAYGGLGADTIHGNAGNDVIVGGDGADVLNGNAGNDLFWAGQGNDTINGGAGKDSVIYEFLDMTGVGNKFLSITKLANDTFSVKGGSFEGTDTLVGIEQLQVKNPYDSNDHAYIDLAKLNNKAIGYTFDLTTKLNSNGEEAIKASLVGIMKDYLIHDFGGVAA